MYAMIVYLLVLAAVVVFEIYLAVMKARDISNYRVLSKPQDDEVELTSAPVGRNESDIKKVRLAEYNNNEFLFIYWCNKKLYYSTIAPFYHIRD